jgi:hypothetical protein
MDRGIGQGKDVSQIAQISLKVRLRVHRKPTKWAARFASACSIPHKGDMGWRELLEID